MKLTNNYLFAALMIVSASLFTVDGYSDDTEIYFAQATADDDENQVAANVMVLVDTSGSMCDPRPSGSRNCADNRTPMSDLRIAFSTLIDNLSDDIKLGLAKFNGGYDSSGYGGYVFYPVSEMTDTAKTEVKSIVNQLQGTSNTPTMEAYSEVARYMLGMSPSNYAKRGEAITNTPRPAVNMNKVSVEKCNWYGCWEEDEWQSDAFYQSPINMNNQCETNHVVVMTDGVPTLDTDYSSVRNLAGGSCNSSYSCQGDLAEWLQGDSPNNMKPVKTWQIAFGISESSTTENMGNVAEDGGTENVYFADNAEELAQAFLEIFNLIDAESKSISAPGVAVNTMNRFQYLDQLFYAVFQPVESSFWEGNLKRYKLSGTTIIDSLDNNAIDDDSGYFSDDSKSFWSSAVDGRDVEKGGAREQVSGRNLYFTDTVGGALKKLSWSSTTVPSDDLIGANTDIERELIFDELGVMWGDPLHSQPIMINYGTNENNNYVFVSTNAGMLHAIDAQTGEEAFSFMPYEMLSKADEFTIRRPGLNLDNSRQLYGLDGSWTAWRKAGNTSSSAPEHVYLYGGMRRGGQHYYALDVTDPEAPEMLWQISNDTTGFEDLGQTWSTPTLTQIKIADPDSTDPDDTINVPVLVFGGGYSPDDHDNYADRTTSDQQGNAVYFVNAVTGELVWSIGGSSSVEQQVTDMKWAIPSGISVVDTDFDGIADHLYFGDLGGQVFRISLGIIAKDTEQLVIRLANLGGTGANHRRFYEAPAVAISNGNLVVTIVSGYRAHPLDDSTNEAIFVIKDPAALYPVTHVEANVGNMIDVTNDPTGISVTPLYRGWYYFLETGEKGLSSPVIYQNKILFTTYEPSVDQEQDNPCVVRYGAAYLHTVSLANGSAQSISGNEDGGGEGEAPLSRRQDLKQTTPPPTPTLIVNEDGEVVVVVGTEIVDDTELGDSRIRKRRWMQLSPDAANTIIDDQGFGNEEESEDEQGSDD